MKVSVFLKNTINFPCEKKKKLLQKKKKKDFFMSGQALCEGSVWLSVW